MLHSDDTLHQEEDSNTHFSLESSKSSKASTQAPTKNIKTFIVQCSKCKKWRLSSTKYKYKENREKILDDPFSCDKGQEWKPDVTCVDPKDFTQEDDTVLWAIDKPNIPRPHSGWERLFTIRSVGNTYFIDVSVAYFAATLLI
ncbi:hypothetical protein HU200_062971 [Digitaria exilis]|uniref:CW-type domain-containing protein n=1 Tax=Digitaria exilis TaxID=1010633 RepID=A0A835A4I9_9POAL|nr:hypothetical protein HU200_062971 [Digitaria exilis]